MLADRLDYVIGVDSHRDAHALALLAAPTGAPLLESELSADRRGYEGALALARAQAPPPEHVVQLLAQEVAHDAATERAKNDDAVNAVDELAPERTPDRALDRTRCKLRLLLRKSYPCAVRQGRAEV